MIIISILAFCFFVFPVFGKNLENAYLVCDECNIADSILVNSAKWQTKDYYVYKLDKSEYDVARFIPNGKIIKEYIFENGNTFKRNPLMQSISSGGQNVIGIPYVID